jgi:hypothetical protein
MKRFAVAVLLFASISAPALANGAACETIIWGNRLSGDALAVAGLVPMVDLSTEAGAAWYAKVNAVLARSAYKLEALAESAPTTPGATFTPVADDPAEQ